MQWQPPLASSLGSASSSFPVTLVNTEDLPLCLVPHTLPGPLTTNGNSSSTADGGEAAQQGMMSAAACAVKPEHRIGLHMQLWLLPSHAGEHGELPLGLVPHTSPGPLVSSNSRRGWGGGVQGDRQQAVPSV
jgi:hypothetical protein